MIPVFIVKYKMPEMEQKCIDLVEQHTDEDLGQAVVYDNSSKNRNLGTLWNELIAAELFEGHSEGEWLGGLEPGIMAEDPVSEQMFVLLNTDCFVTPNWLEKLFSAMQHHKKIGFAGPMTDNCGSHQKVQPGYSPENFKGQVAFNQHLSGFCLLCRVQAWMDAGGFDESAPFYGQESALIEKCWSLGWHTAMVLDCFVHHLGNASAKAAEKRGEIDLAGEKKKGAEWFKGYIKELRG